MMILTSKETLMKMIAVLTFVAACVILSLIGLPEAATLAPGDLLVGDRQGAIWHINALTGVQTQLNPEGIPYPTTLALEADGNILVTSFVCDGCGGSFLPSVYRLNPTTGAWSVLSEGGLFQQPFGIVVTPEGRILVADRASGGVIIEINADTGAQSIDATGTGFGRGLLLVPSGGKKKK
jgi:DNA-binding beta-propeller fold protein YncE